MSVFDQIRDRPFLVIPRDTPTGVTFDEDEEVILITRNAEPEEPDFNMSADMVLRVSSKPLMRALKPFSPLGGKTLVIMKTGRGYATLYKIEEATAP